MDLITRTRSLWCFFQICAVLLFVPIASAGPAAPELWACANSEVGKFGGWPFLWREIDKKCLTNPDGESFQAFVNWQPSWSVVNEDTATMYFLVWVRLIDSDLVTANVFNARASELYEPANILFALYSDHPDSKALERLKNEATQSLNSTGGGYAYSLLLIRILGLVPRSNIEEARQFLEELVLPLGGAGKATGQYGEEILEMIELLKVRSNGM